MEKRQSNIKRLVQFIWKNFHKLSKGKRAKITREDTFFFSFLLINIVFFFFISNIRSNTIGFINFSSGPTQWKREDESSEPLWLRSSSPVVYDVRKLELELLWRPCSWIKCHYNHTDFLIVTKDVTNSLALFNRTLLHYNFPSSITTIAQNKSNPFRLHSVEALSIQTL